MYYFGSRRMEGYLRQQRKSILKKLRCWVIFKQKTKLINKRLSKSKKKTRLLKKKSGVYSKATTSKLIRIAKTQETLPMVDSKASQIFQLANTRTHNYLKWSMKKWENSWKRRREKSMNWLMKTKSCRINLWPKTNSLHS